MHKKHNSKFKLQHSWASFNLTVTKQVQYYKTIYRLHRIYVKQLIREASQIGRDYVNQPFATWNLTYAKERLDSIQESVHFKNTKTDNQ